MFVCFLCVRLSDHSFIPRWTATLITSQLQSQHLEVPQFPTAQLPAPTAATTVCLCGCQPYLGSQVYSSAGWSPGYLCVGGLRSRRTNTKWRKRKERWRELAFSTELFLQYHWLWKTCFLDCSKSIKLDVYGYGMTFIYQCESTRINTRLWSILKWSLPLWNLNPPQREKGPPF